MRRPATRIGLIDVGELVRLKDDRVLDVLTQAAATDEEKKAALGFGTRFATVFPQALEELSEECDCLVLSRSAVAGVAAQRGRPDRSAQAKGRSVGARDMDRARLRHTARARCMRSAAWLARRAADQRALWTHFRRRWYVYLPCYSPGCVAQHYLLFNWTREPPLLRGLARSGRRPSRAATSSSIASTGDELMQLKKGQRFFKRIVGVAGDRVSVEDRRVLINGADVGIAKQYTLDGHRLEPLAPA